MEGHDDAREISRLRDEVKKLREKLYYKEKRLHNIENRVQFRMLPNGLNKDEVERYCRQIVIPNFGVAGQLKLKSTSFFIVGMGGLGCPAAQYLLSSGCKRLGIVDYDHVERSNLHRQTLHSTKTIEMYKVISARDALRNINPEIPIDTYTTPLNRNTALQLLQDYDVILDCTDNVQTRYLLNDACVILKKPLVSGSALQMDGQLTVYNYGVDGPCYRCLFPVPPPPETVVNCGDGGILGGITGVIGALQAVEAIKVAIGLGDVLSGRLLIYDGARCIFRNVKVRTKRNNCTSCSDKPVITQLMDIDQFCGARAMESKDITLLDISDRISVEKYNTIYREKSHLLIDVRQPAEFEMCHLENARNMPLKIILNNHFLNSFPELKMVELPIFVICRRSNDSQIAVHHLKNVMPKHKIRDIVGGLNAWHHKIDNKFPLY